MKDKNVAAILALFLGTLGIHKFYLGRFGVGILYLVLSWTFIPTMLSLIDFFVLALMENDDFDRRYNGHNQIAPVIVNMLPPAYPPQGPGYGSPQHPGPGQMHPHAHAHPHPPAHPPGGLAGYPPPAARGGPMPPGAAPYPAAAASLTTDELAVKLEKLNELRISGLLSEDEFQQQKARLLAQT